MIAYEEWEKVHLKKKVFKILLVLLDTNPVDDNAKLFHQSFPVEKVVGGDKEIPEWFLSKNFNINI